jgi:hypothetical protein
MLTSRSFEASPASAQSIDVFSEMVHLTASDGQTNDAFGYSVALDGDTAVVGAFRVDVFEGAVYVFERNQNDAGQWGFVKKLTKNAGQLGSEFGTSVGISGDIIVVGAFGSAYIFARNQGGPNNWGQVKMLTGSEGGISGKAVAVNGDLVVAGADGLNSAQGAAYLFARNQGGPDNWGEVKKLTASDGVAEDYFGLAVAIDGDTIAIGAPGHRFITANIPGYVYIFGRNHGGADNWGQVKKLSGANPKARFGASIGLSGDTLVVGQPNQSITGIAFLFERNQGGPDNWGETMTLLAGDGSVSSEFGFATAISGDVVIVGAKGDNNNQGASHIYSRNEGGVGLWGKVVTLVASDGNAGDLFGYSVAVKGTDFWVGAPSDDVGTNTTQGSVYVFASSPLEARDDFALTPIDTPVTIYVLRNDSDPIGDPLTLNTVGTPLSGTATIDGSTLIYTPTLGFLGTDTFTYTIGTATESATATVSVLVVPEVFQVRLPLVRR